MRCDVPKRSTNGRRLGLGGRDGGLGRAPLQLRFDHAPDPFVPETGTDRSTRSPLQQHPRQPSARPRRVSAALAGLPDLLGRPVPGPAGVDEFVRRRRALGRPQLDQVLDLEAVRSRRSRIMSPWPRWNSTESSSGHSNRCIPKYGRRSLSVAGPSASRSGTHSMSIVPLTRKISCPPGRSRRAASGIQR